MHVACLLMELRATKADVISAMVDLFMASVKVIRPPVRSNGRSYFDSVLC